MGSYFFVSAVTNFGPLHVPLRVEPNKSITDSLFAECERRGLTYRSWKAERISQQEFEELSK